MAEFETLALQQEGGVCRITMSRPDVFNAFDEAMIGELDLAFAHAIADQAVPLFLATEGLVETHLHGQGEGRRLLRRFPEMEAIGRILVPESRL